MSNVRHVGRAAVVALVVALVVVFVATRVSQDDDDLVRVQFKSAAPLVDGNQVKIDGVVVGTVKDFAVKDGMAEVSLDLDDEAMPLHKDAKLTIRPVSLLGERYIDLDRGSADAPVLGKGEVIPASQTATGVGLDEVLNTVDQPTGEGLSALLTTLGEGMQGNGENVDALLKALSPSMAQTDQLAKVLDEHNELLDNLITNFEPVAAALATRDGKAMDQLVDSSDKILGAVRERQAKLEQTLAKLPATLRVLRSTLGNLRSAADDTAPTLAKLRPLTDKLPEFSNELRAFSDALDPALATSEPVLREADKLLRSATPVAADMRTSSKGLANATDGTERVVGELTDNRDNLFDYIRYWALSTNGYDGLSHYFRVSYVIDEDTVLGLIPYLGKDRGPGKTPAASSPPAKAAAPATKPKTAAPKLLDGVGQLLGGLLQPKGDSATGLSKKQEFNLLGMLLGGN